MIKYLEDNYGERATIGDKSVLNFLRNESSRLQALVDEQKVKTANKYLVFYTALRKIKELFPCVPPVVQTAFIFMLRFV